MGAPALKLVTPSHENGTVVKRRPPRQAKKVGRKHLTAAEIHRLIEAVRERSRYVLRDAIAIETAFRHGFRVSELVALEWSDIDLNAGTILVRRLKGGVTATHYLEGSEIRAFRKLRREGPTSERFVFVTERDGEQMTAAGFRAMLARAGKAAGLQVHAHPHALRHATGYHLANRGKDTRTLSGWLGHKSLQHTQRYTELAPIRFKGFWED